MALLGYIAEDKKNIFYFFQLIYRSTVGGPLKFGFVFFGEGGFFF